MLQGGALLGKKVLLFGDIGIDDTVALIYASLTKKSRLLV